MDYNFFTAAEKLIELQKDEATRILEENPI